MRAELIIDEELITDNEVANAVKHSVIRMSADSGASTHIVKASVPTTNRRPADVTVKVANGETVQVSKRATVLASSNGHDFDFTVLQDESFGMNLFSIKEATRNGYTAVFGKDKAFLHHNVTKQRIPFETTHGGWDLVLSA